MHYFIIITVILIIVFFQWSFFRDTRKKILVFGDIFAPTSDSYRIGNKSIINENINNASEDHLKLMLKTAGCNVDDFYTIGKKEEGIEALVFDDAAAREFLLNNIESDEGIYSSHLNQTFEEIKNAINSYLLNNKGSVSDFHLMKDIVDRNCDAKEEEINTQIPVPLYMGLMGTMVGILVGVGYLWYSGDLSALLDARSDESGAEGIKALLGGVALAMISSITGILLTTLGSVKAKAAKAQEEKNKHVFLSWIQANLLPNLSNDTVQALERMSGNLSAFNNTFSKNTADLGRALSQVNEATRLQHQLLVAVEKLADKNISKQNLEVYNALKNCSEEIGTLGKYLTSTNDYLIAVRDLNEKLDKDDKRWKAVERMAEFFENEATQLEQRKAVINKVVGEIDGHLEEQLRRLSEHAIENVNGFSVALGKQQDALQRRLAETQVIVEELRSLAPIKESISRFEKATTEQNRKIDHLTESIRVLAETKTRNNEVYSYNEKPTHKKPLWKRILTWTVTIVFSLALLALIIANWNAIYPFLLDVFRF